MSRVKSFNGKKGTGFSKAALVGLGIGAAFDLALLPVVWEWVAPCCAYFAAEALYLISPATAGPPTGSLPAPRLCNPMTALPEILAGDSRETFMIASLAVTALCVGTAIANRISHLS